MVDGPVLQSDPEMVKYAGQKLPLRVTGTVDAPSVLPDFGSDRARADVEESKSASNERVDEEREEVRDRVRDRLRGLLER